MKKQTVVKREFSEKRLSRRGLLKAGMLGGTTVALGGFMPVFAQEKGNGGMSESINMLASSTGLSAAGWQDYDKILSRIKAPVFANKEFNIMDFGAVSDGKTDATEAITKAIETCHTSGGGKVIIPKGTFFTGAIHLKSNVNLHISEGALLKFSTDTSKYPRVFTRWEGVECMNFSPLIYAFGQENIAVTGTGMLDGQSDYDNWWGWNDNRVERSKRRQVADRAKLMDMGEKGVPPDQRVFGEGYLLRPTFIQFYHCRNILIEGVTIIRSPMWELNPVLSSNITIRGVKIDSYGPNNDGCDPECCQDVLIEECVFASGDDCIAIKSGRNNDGRRVNVASENIIIRNCHMKDGHGGVVLGSECSGHIRNVFVDNCNMDSPELDRALRFKNNAVRGGILENVFMRNVKVGTVKEAILTIDLVYEEGANGKFMPTVRNVQLDNVVSSNSPRVMFIVSYEGATIDNIQFSNCVFNGVEKAEVLATSGTVSFRNVVISPKDKPVGVNSIPVPIVV